MQQNETPFEQARREAQAAVDDIAKEARAAIEQSEELPTKMSEIDCANLYLARAEFHASNERINTLRAKREAALNLIELYDEKISIESNKSFQLKQKQNETEAFVMSKYKMKSTDGIERTTRSIVRTQGE